MLAANERLEMPTASLIGVLKSSASSAHSLRPDQARDIARMGVKITDAANEQLGFKHPTNDWGHFSFCQVTDPVVMKDGVLRGKNARAVRQVRISNSILTM
jgi:trans-L-3-hydroxyproline dehydratase